MTTAKYLVRRFTFLVLVVWSAATINFFLPRMSGRDPVRARLAAQAMKGVSIGKGIDKIVETYDKKFGLDVPLTQQYINYLGDLTRFDLGPSFSRYPMTVSQLIGATLPWTLGLLLTSTVFSFVFGSIFGALVAWPSTPDWVRSISPMFFAFSAIPNYLLGLFLLYFFAYTLKWFPGAGGYQLGTIPEPSLEFAIDVLKHSLLPAFSIILSSLGFWAIGMRGTMIMVEGLDYMTLAEAKGLKGRTILWKYGLRNALLPQITSFALSLGFVVSGAVLVEIVFAYPGIGLLLFNSIKQTDFPVIQGIVLTLIGAIATATLIIDVGLPFLDPRISRGDN